MIISGILYLMSQIKYIIKINFICYLHFLNGANITFKITYVLK